MRTSRKFALRACAAAVCGALSFGAFGQAAVQSALNEGVLAALDRSLKTPLEIIWLRAAAENQMWNQLELVQAVQRCGKAGTPREGCAVLGRTAFRHVFGGNSPATDGAARLVVSSLNLPGTTFASGRINLSGRGRIYVITPEPQASGSKPSSGAIVLAAGTSVQLVDAAYPSIQVELKAPDDETLLLGSLAHTDLGKALALLVGKPGASASEAVVGESGQIALRSSGEVQFALVAPALNDTAPTALAKVETKALSAEEIVFTQDFAPLAAAIAPIAPASVEFTLLASLAPVAGMPGVEALANAAGTRIELKPDQIRFTEDFTKLASAIESPRPASADFTLSISLAAVVGMPGAEMLANATATRIEIKPERMALTEDFGKLAGAIEASASPASAEFALATSLASLADVVGGEVLANAVAIRIHLEPDQIRLTDDFTKLAGAVERAVTPASVEFTLAASLASVAGMPGVETLANVTGTRIAIDPERLVFSEGFERLAAVVEAPGLPASAEFTLSASLGSLAGTSGGELLANAVATRIELKPDQIRFTEDFDKLASVLETTAVPASAEFTLAATQIQEKPARASAPVQVATSTPASELERMRAEVEAEVARERERLAQTVLGRPAAKRFVFGT